MRRLLRIIFLVAVLSLATIVVIQVVSAQQPVTDVSDPNAEVLDEVTVERGEITVTTSATGTVTPVREVALLFEAALPVAEILVREGQQVEAGDVLARLEVGDLVDALEDAEIALELQRVSFEALTAPPREVDLAAAEAGVNAALASINAAAQGSTEQEVAIARLQTELARNQLWQSQLQRDQTLEVAPEFRAGGTGAFVQELQLNAGVNQAETGVSVSEANYASVLNQGPDQAALGSAAAARVSAEVALERLRDGATEIERQQAEIELQKTSLLVEQAQAAVDRAVLVAPFSGVIARNNLVVGELPPADQAALLLINNDDFYVELGIDETDIVMVEPGQTAELALDALPNAEIAGEVTRIATLPTLSGQLVTYDVRVTLQNTDPRVRSGMSATATIITDQLDDVLIVPNRFIRIDRATQQAFATILDDNGEFTEVPVELGVRNDSHVQVVSGLSEGQNIYLLPRSTFNPFGG